MYSPSKGHLLMKLENLLKSYTMYAEGIKHLNYWSRLKAMGLLSIGRRIERYRIIFSYKVITGKVDNCGLSYRYTDTAGTVINTINTKKHCVQLRENSFHYIGPRLYNCLPRKIRDMTSTSLDDWKYELDKLLEKVPDTPHTSDTVPGLCDTITAKPTNSLLYWLPHLGLNDRRGKSIV